MVPEESSLMVTVPLETKNFLVLPSFSNTVTTPGFSTARVGTWAGRIPKLPLKDGTSTCLTEALLYKTYEKQHRLYFSLLMAIFWIIPGLVQQM